MCLAATWLVTWEYDRLKPVLFRKRGERTRSLPWQFVLIPLFFASGGAVLACLWRLIRLGNFSNYLYVGAALTVIGLVFGLVVAAHYKFMRVGALEEREADLR
jgi:hypothetical protein